MVANKTFEGGAQINIFFSPCHSCVSVSPQLSSTLRIRTVRPSSYHEAKQAAVEYHSSKQSLFRAFHKAGLGAWVKKPIEQDQFALTTWASAGVFFDRRCVGLHFVKVFLRRNYFPLECHGLDCVSGKNEDVRPAELTFLLHFQASRSSSQPALHIH